MLRPWARQSPDTRLRHIKYARQREDERAARLNEQETIRFDSVRQDLQREQGRAATLQEQETVRLDDVRQDFQRERQRGAELDRQPGTQEELRFERARGAELDRQERRAITPTATPTPAPETAPLPLIQPGYTEAGVRERLEPGLTAEPGPDPIGWGLKKAMAGVQYVEDPIAAASLQAVSRTGPLGGPALGPAQQVREMPMERQPIGEELVNPVSAWMGDEEEQRKVEEVLAEAGLPATLMAYFFTSPLNALPIVGFTKADDFVRLLKLASKAKGAARTNILSRPAVQRTIAAIKSEAGGPRVPGAGGKYEPLGHFPRTGERVRDPVGNVEGVVEAIERTDAGSQRVVMRTDEGARHTVVASGAELGSRLRAPVRPRVPGGMPEQPKLPGLEDPHVARADPGPPPTREPGPPGKPPTRPRGPSPDDPEFDDIQRVALDGEQPEETLVRRHDGAINTAKRDAAIEVREANQMLKDVGLGRTFRGSVVASEEGAFKELNSLLHNPSQVASGERVVPDELRPIYDRLRAGTDWEQAARVDFDPDMALVEDYFFRGWQPPEGMYTGEARGALGRSPQFKLPRVNATYDEMIDAGFKPLFENPAEQMRYSRMMGVRYREQMAFIEKIKAKELALPDVGGTVPNGWRVPRVGPAFEGKPYANGNQVAFTRRWAVPDSLANRLENTYGKTPNLGKGTAFGKTINFQAAVDAAVFMPKRAKLIGSVFQHVDFLGRSHVGAWTGFIDALRRGQPVNAVYHLLKWPKSASDIVVATFSPGFRAKLAKLAVDDTPLFEGRNLSNRMISEAGLSLRDVTILPELDQVIRQVAEEGRLARWGKAPLRLLGDLEMAWRKGLFEGVYPAAILTDVKNNIAPAIVRQHPKATDEQLAGMIAKAANASYSTIPAATSVVQNQQARWFLTRFLFSMGENEGLLRAFTGAIRGENAAYFRTRLLGTYLGVIALANTIHFASTGEPLPFSRYTPISKDKWGPLPVGYNRDFAAPNIPLTGRSGAEITVDLMGQMDTAIRIIDPKSFLSARMSVPARALENQRTGKDFFGAPIDTVGPGGIFSRAAQLAQDLFAPIGPGQAGLEALRSNIEETEGLIQPGEDRLGTTGIGIQATGVNLRAETTPQLLDRIRGDVMREMEITDRYEDLDQLMKPKVDAKVEERIGPELEMRRETAELRGQTTPESQFYGKMDIKRGEQEEAQLSADANLNSGQWAGDVWREDLGDRQRESYIRRDELKQDAKIEFEDRPAKNKIDKAINDYFDVNLDDYKMDDGTDDWDGFYGAQDKALAPLSPADRKAVMEEVIHKYDTPTVKEFRKAQDVVDEFYDKPKYEGLSVKESERLDEFLYSTVEEFQRRRLREGGRVLSTRRAILFAAEEIGLPDKLLDVAMRLRHERWRKRLVNPERDEWLIRHERILSKFYPDLLERELSREQEIGLGEEAFEAIAAR